MADADMPFVAVIGGFLELDKAKLREAHAAAREIGKELAKAGFGLVVYLSDEKSLEPYVVSGYCEALAAGSGAIRVRYSQNQRGLVRFKEEPREELFAHHLFPGNDWEVPFYRSLAEEDGVDAVLLVAGGTTTLIAGQIAVARRLPILAVDAFGGSAQKIWEQLAHVDEHQLGWGTRPVQELVVRLKDECAAVAQRRREARQHEQTREQMLSKLTAERGRTRYAAGAFLALLAVCFLGFVYTPSVTFYPFVMLVGLISAGATGALVRAILWGQEDGDAWTSLTLGAIAGFVVGLVYLIPLWVGAPGGVLSAKAATVEATDKIQFGYAVLVAISGGIGSDTVFSRLRQQAQQVAVGPPSQTGGRQPAPKPGSINTGRRL
jgi:hypothetical protein